MTVFTEAQAKEKLEALLEEAAARGEAAIRTTDGREFIVKPAPPKPRGDQALCAEPQRDLSGIVGTWVEDPGFDEAIAAQKPPLSLKERILASPRKRDLSDLIGPPLDDPAFEEALADQRRIDPDMWK